MKTSRTKQLTAMDPTLPLKRYFGGGHFEDGKRTKSTNKLHFRFKFGQEVPGLHSSSLSFCSSVLTPVLVLGFH